MAEVYISQTRPAVINEETRAPRPTEPVKVDEPQRFVPAPAPILNADAAVIMRLPEPPPGAPQPISIGSAEATFTPTQQPVSNDRGPGVIYGEGPIETRVNLPPPPAPIAGNLEVRFVPGPAPVENRDTVFQNSRTAPAQPALHQPILPLAAPPPVQVPQAPSARVAAPAPGSPMYNTGDTYIPGPPEHRGGGDAPRADVINVGNSDVQILPGGPQMNANTDRTFGGGGDPTKQINQEDVRFSAQSGPVNVGTSDVFTAPSAPQTHVPNAEDRSFAPAAQNIGNQESVTGAKGDPTSNFDHGVARIGEWGTGKPKNVKG